MSTYQIKTSTITFEVTAEDSDMACLAANQEIQRRGMPFESQRAELVLLDGGNSLSLGTFSLTGFELPTTWAAISELRKDLLAAAKADAANNWDLRVIRSRGAVLVAEDAEGKTLLSTGDSWDMPKTLKGFKATLATIKSHFPTAAKVFICIGCDAANSVASMNNGQYTPWAGEAQALVHIYPELTHQPEQTTMNTESEGRSFFTATQELMSSSVIVHPASYADTAAALLSIAGSVLRIAKQVGDEKHGLLVSAQVHANHISLELGPVGAFEIALELETLAGVAERLRNLSSSKKFIRAVCAE